MQDNPGGGKSDPVEGVRKRCKKNFPSVAAKSGQFTADEMRKGQFLRENRRNLAGEGVVRDFVSTNSSECV